MPVIKEISDGVRDGRRSSTCQLLERAQRMKRRFDGVLVRTSFVRPPQCSLDRGRARLINVINSELVRERPLP
jgi:hypothetical protein